MIAVSTRILVQVTIYRRLLIGRDGHLDQYENTAPAQADHVSTFLKLFLIKSNHCAKSVAFVAIWTIMLLPVPL